MAEKPKQNRTLTIVGWSSFLVACVLIFFRMALDIYPSDDFSALLVLFLGAVVVGTIVSMFGFISDTPKQFSILFGGVLCPGLLIFVIISLFCVSSHLSRSTVMYLDDDPSEAYEIKELTFFDPTEYSVVQYKIYRLTVRSNNLSVEYSSDRDVLEFHKLYYGDEERFGLEVDSALIPIIDQATKDCHGEFRWMQICYVGGVLSDCTLPDNVVLTGRIYVAMDANLNDIVVYEE